MSWPAQLADLNPVEPVWNELDQNVWAKQPQMQLATGKSYSKVKQNYIQSTASLW